MHLFNASGADASTHVFSLFRPPSYRYSTGISLPVPPVEELSPGAPDLSDSAYSVLSIRTVVGLCRNGVWSHCGLLLSVPVVQAVRWLDERDASTGNTSMLFEQSGLY
jgi:hypothetical protein